MAVNVAAIGLPPKILDRSGATVDASDALAGATSVMLYFSASWCPPCRQFSPILDKWLAAHAAGTKSKLVFVSSDNDQASFQKYFHEHTFPFAVAPGSDAGRKLSAKYKINGIPALLVVDAATGELLTADGREGVMMDGAGGATAFPWKPKSFWDMMGSSKGPLVDAAGGSTPVAALKELDYVMLYYSASWCGPCRGFTPKLVEWYKQRKAAGGGPSFDIVFVSSDQDAPAFQKYLAEMPWKALPFAERELKEALSRAHGVRGIPTLVLVRKDGTVATADARSKVESDPAGFPWPPKSVDTLEDATDYINEERTLVAFTDKLTSSENELALHDAVKAVADKYFADAGGKPSDAMRFAIAQEGDRAIDAVRKFINALKDKDGPTAVRLVVLDIPNGEKAYMPVPEGRVPTREEIAKFVADVIAGSVDTVGVKA